jgi:hypothetical protein
MELMFGSLLSRLDVRICMSALTLATSGFVATQAPGPQRVPIPTPSSKTGAAKSKTDRSTLPPIPIFKDIAKDAGITVSHIAAAEARYVIDSTSGGVGLFDCDNDGKLDLVLVNG